MQPNRGGGCGGGASCFLERRGNGDSSAAGDCPRWQKNENELESECFVVIERK